MWLMHLKVCLSSVNGIYGPIQELMIFVHSLKKEKLIKKGETELYFRNPIFSRKINLTIFFYLENLFFPLLLISVSFGKCLQK